MSSLVFLRGARQLLTLRGPNSVRRGAALSDLAVIPDGSVLIQDGRILSVGSTRRMENLREARHALEIPVHGKVVMPGFIDAGVQLTLNRNRAGAARRPAEFLEDSLTLMRSCLQYGTVLVKVHASADRMDSYPDIAVLRNLKRIYDSPIRLIRTWRVASRPAEDCAATLQTLLRRDMVDAIAVTVDGTREPDWELLEPLRSAGLRMDVLWVGGPIALFRNVLERLRPVMLCSAQALTVDEAQVLAQTDSINVLPAGKEVFEGSGTPAVRMLIDRGGAIALSSGYHSALAPNFNMQMAIALAVTRFRLSPEEAVTAATINAACAAGCAQSTGSLEVGKQADINVLNIPDVRDLSLQFSVNHVAMVFRAGNIVLNRTRWRGPGESPGRVRSKSL